MKHLLPIAVSLLPLAACSESGDPTPAAPEVPASTVSEPAATAGTAAATAAESVPVAEAPPSASESPAIAVAEDVVKQAEKLLQDVQVFLDAGNLEKAQLAVGKLDVLRDQLPASLAAKIDPLKAAVDQLVSAKQQMLPGLEIFGQKLPGGG